MLSTSQITNFLRLLGIKKSKIGYKRIPSITNEDRKRPTLVWISFAGSLLIASLIWLCAAPSVLPTNSFPPFKLQRHWAKYSPYFAVDNYLPAPEGCEVIQANIIQRHGTRYPTTNASLRIGAALSKLLSVSSYADSSLNFLKTYKYNLGVDDLLPFGAREAQESGEEHYNRYRDLFNQDIPPFIRASSSQRVVDSARNWTIGYARASNYNFEPKLNVILRDDGNDTLANKMCPEAQIQGEKIEEWISVYASPIAARMNKQAPGAELTAEDIQSLITICAFESLSQDLSTLSPFCSLFSDTEFELSEYFYDLQTYYLTGYGQPLGAVQGVGYINELLARLSGQPVHDNTQTNHTLDSSPVTFPLDRQLYVDFSHDNQMIAIYTAMGLFRQPTPLNSLHADPKRTWKTHHMVTFSARMITEKLLCGQKEYVRVFVNDGLQPLEFCGAKSDGLCTLDAFIDSQSYSRHNGEGDFEKCFK